MISSTEMDEGANKWREALRRGVQFSETTRCRTLEMISSPDKPHWIENTVDDATLPRWVDTVPTRSPTDENDTSGTPSVLGLRLLVATAGWNDQDASIRVSFRDDTFAHLQTHSGLPAYFISLVTNRHTRGFQFSVLKQNSKLHRHGFFFKIPYYRDNFFQIAIEYNRETKISTGFAVIRSGCDINHVIQSGTEALGNPGPHPLLLPLIFLDGEVVRITDSLHIHHQKLDDLEAAAGQHEYTGVLSGNPLELDFVSATRRLNFIGCGVNFSIKKIKCISLALNQLTKWRHSLELGRSDSQNSSKQESSTDSDSILASRADYLENTCHILLLEAESEQSRVHALSQAVYQFMAAKDAKTNLSLAKTSAIIAKASKEDSAIMRIIAIESRRDSLAMKTISILGMVFLPGTFVAAIFAMPVFDWDGVGAPAIKSGFKYYWAVAIPLTILVLTIWALGVSLPWKKWFAKKPGSPKTHHSQVDIELTGVE